MRESLRVRRMKTKQNTRNGFIHLYNPKKEGLGSYDVHYINAYKKIKKTQDKQELTNKERYAA